MGLDTPICVCKPLIQSLIEIAPEKGLRLLASPCSPITVSRTPQTQSASEPGVRLGGLSCPDSGTNDIIEKEPPAN